ncbi:succinylglutamate desuccinylase [Salinimicrobium marinum]|uniref:Succinylglutamate desuccinylase n=1 Tax=Salinimicrobium marinum TaxID=680283 RepID=A0A918VUW9_9FLAO|nr:succinylglutamate desuccinylase/aspartoacylase family protein [Salinimicrobium marinum]GHA31474.1 succinylglutamate desuccinylase [Salinimicrobium marinum]
MNENKQNTRIIGKYEGDKEGPLLLVTAGVHGNEPSGVKALESVFAELKKTQPSLKGTLLGLRGNDKALGKGKRFIDEDLNRTWTEKNLQTNTPASHEQKEMQEIIEILKDYSEEKYPERYFIDCHTTSSDSLPYISVQEVGKNDAFAHRFPGYIVRGFSDIVDGSIDKYFSKQGITGFTFEAGQHTAKTSEENHRAIILLALNEACGLDLKNISDHPEFKETYENKFEQGQKTFKIIYRHGIEDETEFKMKPGFENFEKITKGQVLAVQDGKEIKSEWDARIFMPLYQSQGNDGFFVIEEAE